MRKIAIGLLIFLFLLSCKVDLTNLDLQNSIEKNISILMKVLDRYEPNNDGWIIIEVKDKKYEENNIKFIAFKHKVKKSWGVGITNGFVIVVVGYDSEHDVYYYQWVGLWTLIIEQKDFNKFFTEWVELILSQSDLSSVKPFRIERELQALLL